MLTTNHFFLPEMFILSFHFFPSLSDSSSLSLYSAHPFIKISIDPFPSEVQCPQYSPPDLNISWQSGVSFAYTHWMLVVKCAGAKDHDIAGAKFLL